jgi:extradiol dioxygenase family protein
MENKSQNIAAFHLAYPVLDLEKTLYFYRDLLGCKVGRSAERWIDFDFWGNQISAHLVDEEVPDAVTNHVDGKSVPVRHFGAILEWNDWQSLADKLKKEGISFVIEPYIRFKGEVGEQATMFFMDPSGNAIEFKAFQNPELVFAS